MLNVQRRDRAKGCDLCRGTWSLLENAIHGRDVRRDWRHTMLDFTCSDVNPSMHSMEFEITRYGSGHMYISEVYSHFQHSSLPITINMAPTVTLVPGRKKNHGSTLSSVDFDSAKIRRRMGIPTTDVPSSLLDVKHG